MVMNLERLSNNLLDIIDVVLKNQELVNLIGYNKNFPIQPPDMPVNPKDIAPYGKMERILPYPFNIEYNKDVRTQLHIYYPNFTFVNNANASEVIVLFDIIVHKNIWLMMDNGKKVIRPYQIASKLFDTFNDKSIGKLGKIHFIEGSHTIVNTEFEGLRLVAKFTEF